MCRMPSNRNLRPVFQALPPESRWGMPPRNGGTWPKILPSGVFGKFTGDAQEFKKSVTSLIILLLVAIFLKYIMLGILYEATSIHHDYHDPAGALFGGLLTLLAFGRELSI